MVTTTRQKILPQNYLECLMEKGRAFTLHQHHERMLSKALGVAPSDLPEAIDKMRSGVHDAQLAIMYGNFLKAEKALDEAVRLYDMAVELQQNRTYAGLDE